MIPPGYEDFVSSHEELLKQFQQLSESARDEAVVCIHQLGLETADLATQLAALQGLRTRIMTFLREDIDQYLWNHSKLELWVMQKAGFPCHLKGIVFYGNNVEDEWYTVYLMQKLSVAMESLAISVEDNDGQFMLIEAADHLEPWLSPATAQHRIWIRRGAVHCIPLEAPGSTSDGVRISAALTWLAAEPCPLSASAQRAINLRSQAHPAKALAHAHHVAAIVPYWLAEVLRRCPQAVAQAINAFSDTEADQLSKAVSGIALPANASHTAMEAVSIRMTRTLYAQLTFKKFKVPRRFHPLVRAVQAQGSAKASKALDLGCRVASGLLLAYQQEVDRGGAGVREEVVTEGEQPDHLSQLIQASSTLCSDAIRAVFASLSAAEEQALESKEHHKAVAEAIRQDALRNDSDSWIYLDPDQLDKEMAQRMEQFAGTDSKSMDANEQPPAADEPMAEDLQEVANRFTTFLAEESDYDGINSRPVGGAKKREKVVTPAEGAGGGDLDLDYINQLVAASIAEAAAGQDGVKQVEPAVSGIAMKELGTGEDEEEEEDEETDSDDEDFDEDDHDDDDDEDDVEGQDEEDMQGYEEGDYGEGGDEDDEEDDEDVHVRDVAVLE